ncbi:MAG: NAD+ synthase [Deltaproteobacteria bacterium]|nr:NAD+ synthase [Deltaproteobacteria bacterium]
MSVVRVALAQINPTVGDLEGNVALIERYLDQARQAGAHVVLFPELAVSGYPPEDLLMKPRFLQDAALALERLAPACQDLIALVGFPESADGVVYNAAAVLSQGRALGRYRKLELPNYGVFDEKRYFTPGERPFFLDLGGIRAQLTICEDVWIPGNTLEQAARRHGAQLVLNLSASPFFAGKLAIRQEIMGRYAQASGAVVCHNNLIGGQDELVFDGGSLVVTPRGRVLAAAQRFQEDLVVLDLDLPPWPGPLESPEVEVLALDAPAPPPGPARSGHLAPAADEPSEMLAALVLGTRDYVQKNGFKRVVLGLSGGIDSALTAAIAVEALGAANVVGVTMPSRYTSGETKSDAELVAANLGIELFTLPIAGILESYLGELGRALGEEVGGVTEENLQARIRGNLLMALSNRHGWLVLTTGNKSETAVGYCTLYGDMAGGFAVIKDVLKTRVYQLAELVNQRAGRELIPQSTIDRPPSAELRPDQKDTDSLPPYEVLDPVLQAYVEQDKVLDEIACEGHDPALVVRVARMVDLNEYKRRQAPPGVKISPKAFGKDRRLPITNLYRPGWN